MEDDEPLWISIPIKNTTRKKQSRTFTSNKDSSTERGVKGRSPETAQKQQEPEQTNSMLGSQTLTQKMKRMKGKGKKNEPKKNIDELCSPEDLPAGNLMEHEEPNKTQQQVKEAPSKESDKVGKKPPDTASRKTQKENPMLKMQKKEQKSSATKTSKSLRVGNKGAKMDKSLKRGKVTQPSGSVKDQSLEQSCDEHAESEDLDLFSGNLFIKTSCCDPLCAKHQKHVMKTKSGTMKIIGSACSLKCINIFKKIRELFKELTATELENSNIYFISSYR